MNEKEMLEHKFQTLRQVVRAVTGVDPLENSRLRPVVDAKRIFCQIIYDQKKEFTWNRTFSGTNPAQIPISYITTHTIGKFLNRAHCSILHLLKTTPILLKSEPKLKEFYNLVYAKFGKDIYKRLQFTNMSILRKEEELKYLYELQEELVNLKNAKHEKDNVPRQGVLFEIPLDDKSFADV